MPWVPGEPTRTTCDGLDCTNQDTLTLEQRTCPEDALFAESYPCNEDGVIMPCSLPGWGNIEDCQIGEGHLFLKYKKGRDWFEDEERRNRDSDDELDWEKIEFRWRAFSARLQREYPLRCDRLGNVLCTMKDFRSEALEAQLPTQNLCVRSSGGSLPLPI